MLVLRSWVFLGLRINGGFVGFWMHWEESGFCWRIFSFNEKFVVKIGYLVFVGAPLCGF